MSNMGTAAQLEAIPIAFGVVNELGQRAAFDLFCCKAPFSKSPVFHLRFAASFVL